MKLDAIWGVILTTCFFGFLSVRSSAQILLDEGMTNEYEAEADLRMADFLDRESRFPEKYAVFTSYTLNVLREDSLVLVKGYQILVFDSKANHWRAFQSGIEDEKPFMHEAFYDGKRLCELIQDQWISRTHPAKWQVYSDVVGLEIKPIHYFNPRYVWLNIPGDLSGSMEGSSADVLAGDCFASKRDEEKDVILGLFSKEKAQGKNPVTEVGLTVKGLPCSAKLMPGLPGDFNAKECLKILKESQFSCFVNNLWVDVEEDFFVIKETTIDAGYSDMQESATFKNRWIFDSRTVDAFCTDPRLQSTPSLKEIDFKVLARQEKK